MKVGDLVECMHSKDLRLRRGIIVCVLPNGPFGIKTYRILCTDGTVYNYTGAAVRKINK